MFRVHPKEGKTRESDQSKQESQNIPQSTEYCAIGGEFKERASAYAQIERNG